jgi:hypothetical protein
LSVTVNYPEYETGEATGVIINPGQDTDVSFDLRWLKPCLSLEPTSLETTLNLGETDTQQLVLTNDGAATANFEVSDSDQGYLPLNGLHPAVPGVPDGPKVTPQGASSDAGVQLYQSHIEQATILHITTTDTSQSVERALQELGYEYDLYSGSPWTGIDFTPYDTVIVGMDGGLAEMADIQKLRTDVIDEGKKLIFLGGTCYQPFAQGMNAYLVLNDVNNYCWTISGTPHWTLVDAGHPLADGLPDSYNFVNSSAAYYQIRVNDPDLEPVAMNGDGVYNFFRKNDNYPLNGSGIEAEGDFIWFINSVYSFYWTDPADFEFLKQLISNSIEVSGGGDALWLTEDPLVGTVDPDGDTQTIDVTFDAGMVSQPGTYTALVNVDSDDPINDSFEVTATMHVSAPEDWGRLEGTVQSLGYCDVNPVPLEEAIVWPQGAISVTTDAAGYYAIWLAQGTYTVAAAYENHTTVEAEVEIVGGGTTQQDFDLRLLVPCVSAEPDAYEVTVGLGYSLTDELELTNSGAADSEFQLAERNGGFTPGLLDLGYADPDFPRGDAAPSSGPVPGANSVSRPEINRTLGLLAGAPANAMELIAQQLVYFESETPGYTPLYPAPGAFFAGDFINGDFSTLYALDYNSNSLNAVDVATGAITYIGPSSPVGGESWSGMTGAADGTMYASSTSISNSTLYTVDLDTGATTVVGSITGAACIIDIAITPQGDMYGHDICQDAIYSIDPATGAASYLGMTGFDANYAQGMDFEEESGVLYLTAFNNANFEAELRAVDTSTGNTTLVWSFGYFVEIDSTGFATGGGSPDIIWLSEDPVTGTVEADSEFYVDLIFDATVLTQTGDYTGTLRVKNDDPENGSIDIPLMLHVVPAAYGVDLSGDDALSGVPGEIVQYTLVVTNSSNGPSDTFDISVGASVFPALPDVTEVGPLAPGESATFHVAVEIPVDAMGGESDAVDVTVTSQGDDTKSATATLTTSVTGTYGVTMTSEQTEGTGYPGGSVAYTVHLVNSGSLPDTIELNVLDVDPGWEVVLVEDSFDLDAGESVDITFHVMIPVGAETGDWDIFTLQAVSSHDPTKWNEVEFTTTVAVPQIYLPFINKP